MPGFFISNTDCHISLNDLYPDRLVKEALPFSDGTVKRSTLGTFADDKAFLSDEDGIVVSEGVLLNKKDLFLRYGCKDVASLLRAMYAKQGETFASELRGTVSCALYLCKENRWLIYTNHTGEQAIYYAAVNGKYYVGSQVNYVLDALKAQSEPLSLNVQATYQMLTFGYTESDGTYANEIRHLRGGMYLRITNSVVEVLEYHRFERHSERYAGSSMQEILDELDKRFRHAVELEYAKDEEYGYSHFAEISGGMDSRMGMWVAHSIKPRHIQLLTYCMSDYLDERYSKKIAEHWHDELFAKPLNSGNFFYDIDANTFMLGGLNSFESITGGKSALEALNFPHFGLDHTGQLGGAVISSYCHSDKQMRSNLPHKRASERLSARLEENSYHDNFPDHEIYLLYTRGFQGICGTHQLRRNFAEPVSPFMDTDLLQFCLDIPVEMRMNRKLYNHWVIQYYPEAAEIPWEGTGGKITDNRLQKLWHRLKKRGPDKLLELLGMPEKARFSMNPLDYLARRGSAVREYMDAYEKSAYDALPVALPDTLKADMKELYAVGNAEERCLVLTVLAALKQYFGSMQGR